MKNRNIDENTVINAGQVIVFTNDAYSDYEVQRVMVAARDVPIFKLKEILEEKDPKMESEKFINILTSLGYLVNADAIEINTDDYPFRLQYTEEVN